MIKSSSQTMTPRRIQDEDADALRPVDGPIDQATFDRLVTQVETSVFTFEHLLQADWYRHESDCTQRQPMMSLKYFCLR